MCGRKSVFHCFAVVVLRGRRMRNRPTDHQNKYRKCFDVGAFKLYFGVLRNGLGRDKRTIIKNNISLGVAVWELCGTLWMSFVSCCNKTSTRIICFVYLEEFWD